MVLICARGSEQGESGRPTTDAFDTFMDDFAKKGTSKDAADGGRNAVSGSKGVGEKRQRDGDNTEMGQIGEETHTVLPSGTRADPVKEALRERARAEGIELPADGASGAEVGRFLLGLFS